MLTLRSSSPFYPDFDMIDMSGQNSAVVRWTHVLLRIFAGAVLWQHGAQKMFGLFGGIDGAGHGVPAGFTLSGFAGPIELIGGVLIVVGLFTRPVAFLLAGEMAVAYFAMHFPRNFWPVQNHGEVPVLLCFIFLHLATTGAGIFSLDHLRLKRPAAIMG
jgi:putative oxidoreductase